MHGLTMRLSTFSLAFAYPSYVFTTLHHSGEKTSPLQGIMAPALKFVNRYPENFSAVAAVPARAGFRIPISRDVANLLQSRP